MLQKINSLCQVHSQIKKTKQNVNSAFPYLNGTIYIIFKNKYKTKQNFNSMGTQHQIDIFFVKWGRF